MTEEKKRVRQAAKNFRSQLKIDPDWATQAAQIFFERLLIDTSAVVSTYYPIGQEIDPSPIISELWKRGVNVCLPVVVEDAEPLKFAKWTPQSGLLPNSLGILEPAEKEWIIPDILIVPLLAFDQQGNRMGYGKGHYDATIAQLRKDKNVLCVGLAFAEQAVLLALPTEPHDQKLDIVVTPQRFFDFRQ